MSILFLQLNKADAKRRIVYGTAVSETVDRANEIFDYETSKPYFEKWSNEMFEASGGKSKGNIRSMHNGTTVAAGKVTDIAFDDTNKAIKIAAQIVDDSEWRKVESGVYTGFSIGGRYAKRWQDGDLQRYTAEPSEISLVDLPCVKDATFEMIKVDGSEELRKFYRREDAELMLKAFKAKTNRCFEAAAGIAPRCEDPPKWDREIAKRGLLGHLDGSHSRIEFASAATEHGLIQVALDQASDTLHVHGHAHPMSLLSSNHRDAIYAVSAAFNAAENQDEQAQQRIVLGALIDAAMARDQKLSDRVKTTLQHQRYD